MKNQALIILGMHRSGTSATTGMLRCLGVTLGEDLYKGHDNVNAKGYFEHSGIADTDEEALLALNSSWDDILIKPEKWWKNSKLNHFENKIKKFIQNDFSKAQAFAIKDPRICRLLPWWIEILKSLQISPRYLIVLRPPHEVYLSLNKRDDFSLEKSYLLWVLHYLDAEYWTRNESRAFVTFENLTNDPVLNFEKIENNLSFKFPTPPNEAQNCLSQFISPDLIHHRSSNSPDSPQNILTQLADDLYNSLLSATTSSEIALDHAYIDKINAEVKSLQQSFSPLLCEHIKSTNQIRSDLQITMNKVFRSNSWVLGKPIRFFERLFGMDV